MPGATIVDSASVRMVRPVGPNTNVVNVIVPSPPTTVARRSSTAASPPHPRPPARRWPRPPTRPSPAVPFPAARSYLHLPLLLDRPGDAAAASCASGRRVQPKIVNLAVSQVNLVQEDRACSPQSSFTAVNLKSTPGSGRLEVEVWATGSGRSAMVYCWR